MSNFIVQDEKTILYPTQNDGSLENCIILIEDKDMIPGTVRWDTTATGFMFYNLSEYSTISSISDSLLQVYNKFVIPGTFAKVPSPNDSIPNWATFNPEDKSFYLRFDLVFNIRTDYSSVPTCKFYTSPHSSFSSDEYQYANKSKGDICSEPVLNAKSSGVAYCPYYQNLFADMPAHSCQGYSADSKILSLTNLSSKHSENKINITVTQSRMDAGKTVNILFKDQINNTVFHDIKFSSLDKDQLDSIPTMVQSILDEILESYKNDFNIDTQDVISQVVKIERKSFISSLIERENQDVYI
jgi:hypothetical protein